MSDPTTPLPRTESAPTERLAPPPPERLEPPHPERLAASHPEQEHTPRPEQERGAHPEPPRQPDRPAYKTGPAVGTLTVGLLGLATLALVLLGALTDLSIDWARVGPVVIVGVGVGVVLLGLLGMRAQRSGRGPQPERW